MYREHFGLVAKPFRITPDTRRFFVGARRGAVLDALIYAVEAGEGIVKVVGEVGSGKTMLCRMLAERLPEAVEIAYLANPGLSRDDILPAIALELGLPTRRDASRLDLVSALQAHLLERHAAGRRVVVFIEEAQGMALDALEEVRFLSNIETREDKLLQIVLFGQPELDRRLAVHAARQLRDRITHSFCLTPLSTAEVRDYVRFRLRVAGHADGELFSPAALWQLARASGGLMRRIHILADKALMAAYAQGDGRVRYRHVGRAVADGKAGHGRRFRLPTLWAGATGLAAALVAVAGYTLTPAPVRVDSAALEAAATAPRAGAPAAPQRQPATEDLLAERQRAALQWLDAGDDGFTIQVLLSDDAATAPLARFLSRPELAGLREQLYVYPTEVGGVRRWSVVYGRFGTYGEAAAALQQVPKALRTYRPYLRSVRAVRREAAATTTS